MLFSQFRQALGASIPSTRDILLVVPTAMAVLLRTTTPTVAQETATPNGIADNRSGAYAFTNALIYEGRGNYRSDATLLIKEGRIEAIQSGQETLPAGFFEIDLEGRSIYPGLIDAYSSYGIPELESVDTNGAAENLTPDARALNANDAIRSNFRATEAFSIDTELRNRFRNLGFSTVLSLRPDGIARGNSALITLGDHGANESIIVPDVATHFSLDKGSSVQTVPVSLMGAVALLRQTHLDAEWYTAQDPRPFTDPTLEAFSANRSLPQIFEVENWQLALTADRVGDEFNTQFLLKTSGDSYQRADLIAETGASLIVPLDFPEAPDVSDPISADAVSFEALKHWELAPFNTRLLAEAGIEFALTSSDASADFWTELRTAVANGLPEDVAMAALTTIPAQLLGVSDSVGQLATGQLANFLITDGELFAEDTLILENWIQGQRFVINSGFDEREGLYSLTVDDQDFTLELRFEGNDPSAEINPEAEDNRRADIDLNADTISLRFRFDATGDQVRLTGWPTEAGWRGNGRTPDGDLIAWQLDRQGPVADAQAAAEEIGNDAELPSAVLFPFVAYGREAVPLSRDLLIRDATVWTVEEMGTLVTDVLVRNGKIAEIGNDLDADNVQEVDGSDKHLTPGIIDEHSHIALFNINEVATNSSMVRMQDVVDSKNVNIYRNLAGGVVAAQLLHGSANPIGGQSAIIKMRWGSSPQELLIQDAPGFIKFALGENVKRSRNPASVRYPQTRMGVEQVFVDAFSQAREYEQTWADYNSLSAAAPRSASPPRRDLIDETMLEVLNGERYVTSHSYVQSEINMLMHVADSFGFNINTFTHILEGYKVADKMAAHGAGGSTFADWWAYKWEVRYAIPYNAALMHQAGVTVAINSDDAEMSRRLNQEAAKVVKYGDVSEIEALQMITLNPAKLLHLDHRTGSIRVGKDADLVLWSDHPLSVYAVPETTWIEGTPYYDRAEDIALREMIASERARIIARITRDESDGSSNAGED